MMDEMKMHHYEGTLYNMDGTKTVQYSELSRRFYETFMDYRTIDWADRVFYRQNLCRSSYLDNLS